MIQYNKLENSDGTRIDFNDISLESLGTHLVFGDVDSDTMKEAISFILKSNLLFNDKREITLFLNTCGGSCYDGFSLIDVMEISRLPVKTIGSGNIVSMGVFLLCAGTKGRRVMTKNTQVMAHQFSDENYGKFHELVSAFKANLYLEQQSITHFIKHTSMNEKQVRDILFGPTDKWLSPSECKKYGLVDHVIDELPDFNLALPAQTPSSVLKRRGRK